MDIQPPPFAAPPTAPGPLPPPVRRAVNIPGLLGLIFCGVAAVASPAGFFVFPLCFLLPLGGIGLMLSLIGCFFKPRWYGIVGLIVGVGCVLFWGVMFFPAFFSSGRFSGLAGMGAKAQTSMTCAILVTEVESARASSGALPTTFTSSYPPVNVADAWGRPYRYVLTPITAANPYGYTFIGDGADGIAGTSDDVDLIAIHPTDGSFPLPPAPPAAPAPVPSPPG